MLLIVNGQCQLYAEAVLDFEIWTMILHSKIEESSAKTMWLYEKLNSANGHEEIFIRTA